MSGLGVMMMSGLGVMMMTGLGVMMMTGLGSVVMSWASPAKDTRHRQKDRDDPLATATAPDAVLGILTAIHDGGLNNSESQMMQTFPPFD